MSPTVQILPQTLINKIAAGEVIVRPASVVKELVENSFDAAARHVRVEVSRDGRSISVTDDGSGMDEENAKRAILRHSTSKIREFEDLTRLTTRGFRGEALASIISVSRFEMLTRRSEDAAGVRLVASGGRVERVEPVGTAPGAAIHVRDLFYNTPARLKFLKSPSAEFNVLAQILAQHALSRPDVGLTCVRGDAVHFDLPADQDLRSRIEELLGSSVQGRLLEVRFEREGLSVRGYVSRPEASRKDRRWQYLMVNGRPIAGKQLSYPLQDAYKGLLMPQRFPVAVLDLGLDPAEVDVNVHPTKEEVRFEEERKVAGLLHRAVSQTLHESNLIPSLEVPVPATRPTPGAEEAGKAGIPPVYEPTPAQAASPAKGEHPVSRPRPEPPPGPAGRMGPAVSDDPSLPFVFSPKGVAPYAPGTEIRDFPRPRPETRDLFPASDFARRAAPPKPGVTGASPKAPTWSDRAEQTPGPPAQARPSGRPTCEGPPSEPGPLDVSSPGSALALGDGPPPVPLGQIGRSYVVAEWGDDLLLIDQHAAHERLIHRRLQERASQPVPLQLLLAPILFRVAAAELDTMAALLPILRESGFEIEKGAEEGEYVARSLPADSDAIDVGAYVQDVLDDVAETAGSGRSPGLDEMRERVRVRIACHAAIKAGQRLSPEEIAALVREITEARFSFTCPHGRPTMVLLRKGQLDRQFGRG
jgi:DNA mismatch repair protein MutL